VNASAEISRVLAREGLVCSRDHPELGAMVRYLARQGRLIRLLPGIFCEPGRRCDEHVRIVAATAWRPDGVLVGLAAAKLGFWPKVPVPEVVVAHQSAASLPGFRTVRWVPKPEHVIQRAGVRFTDASLSAIWLAATDEGVAIDEALRRRVATLDSLTCALASMKSASGNAERRRVLHESRENPWSQGERRLHAWLFTAGYRGWKGNYPVTVNGHSYFLDVAFPGEKVAIEFDGLGFHQTREQLLAVHRRQNDLVAAGWRMLRVSWTLFESPVIVDWLRSLGIRTT